MKPYRPILLLTINENLIISGVLPVADPSVAYIGTLVGRGGLSPYLWFLDSGSLPSGLTLSTDSSNNGIISGTTSDLGPHTFVILLRDSEGRTATREFTLVVQVDALTITGDAPSAEEDEPYSFTYDIDGGIPPYFPSVVVMPGYGPLPSGLTLSFDSNDDLVLHGTPDVAGSYTFQIWMNDSQTPVAGFASLIDTISVGAAPLTVTGAFTDTDVGDPLNGSPLAISGGLAPYSLSGSPYSGTRPAGVTISVSGTDLVATGNTDTEDTYSWTERVLDSSAQHYDVVCSMEVLGASDPYWANVSSLLYFDGTDGSTSFPDEKGVTWTVAGTAGRVSISTDESKFGGASGEFITAATSGRLYSSSLAAFGFGSGDFTIEGWCYVPTGLLGVCALFDTRSGSDAGCGIYRSAGHADGRRLTYYNNDSLLILASTSYPLDAWFFWSVQRISGVVYIHLDGVNVGSAADSRTFASSAVANWGANYVNTQPLSGYLDCTRVTKGVARYGTGTYTVPTERFPNS